MACLRYSSPKSSLIAATVFTIATLGDRPADMFSSVIGVEAVEFEFCDNSPCLNGGQCLEGAPPDFGAHPHDWNGKPLSFHDNPPCLVQYCNCTEGFTGWRCGQSFEVCSKTQDGNGNFVIQHACYNGGKCLTDHQSDTPTELHICDCTDAVHQGQEAKVVGKYCERLARSPTTQGSDCNPSDNGSDLDACLNGGECIKRQDNTYGCFCEPEFFGTHCEFHSSVVPACSLQCQNGGTCELGIRGMSFAESSPALLDLDRLKMSPGMQHCKCPPGYVGHLCDIQSIECGTLSLYGRPESPLFCLHGSQCVNTTNPDGVHEYHCDCNTAHTESESYAGVGCQYKASSFCQKSSSLNGHQICVNDGTCIRNDDGTLHCECPAGFHGDSCEFPDWLNQTEQHHERPCALLCQNGGTCTKGIKDFGLMNKWRGSLDHMMNNYSVVIQNNKANHDWHNAIDHCTCPEGYTGSYCEHKVEVCGDNEHVCFYGAQCKPNRYGLVWECDCDATGMQVAGRYCEHLATATCADGSFCVNNGICGESHRRCICPPEAYGDHCEYGQSDSAFPPAVDDPRKNILISLVSVVASGLGLMICLVCWTRYHREQSPTERKKLLSPAASGNKMSDNIDQDTRTPPRAGKSADVEFHEADSEVL